VRKAVEAGCEAADACKRGLAYVWLHYVYEPICYRRRAKEVRSWVEDTAEATPSSALSRLTASRSLNDLDEAVTEARSRPFRARLPTSGADFFAPKAVNRRPQASEVRRTVPERRKALRDALEEWRATLLGLNDGPPWRRRLCRWRARPWRQHYFSRVPLEVRRSDVFDSCVDRLLAATAAEVLSGIHVRFVADDGSPELGVDSGGLTREFLDMALRSLVEGALPRPDAAEAGKEQRQGSHKACLEDSKLPGRGEPMFREQADNTLMLRRCGRPDAVYFALGRLVAAALVHASYGGVALPIVFNDCLLKYMVGQPIAAADVRRRDPIYFKNRMEALLEPEGLEAMCAALGADRLVFESDSGAELLPGGSMVEVTPQNVSEYIELISEDYLCGSVRVQLSHFLAGFHCVVPKEILNRCGITFADLGMLLSGVAELSVAECASAVERAAGVPERVAERVAGWFWEVLHAWPQEERSSLLAFATGCSRLPAVGFEGLDPPFQVEVVPLEGLRGQLPTAHTCKHAVTLPAYASKAQLAAKLSLAASEGTGTGFDLR